MALYTENLLQLDCGYIGNYITKFDEDKISSSFYLKESNEHLNYILDKGILEMKATTITVGGQPVIILLFKFAGNDKFIYGRIYNKSIDSDKEHLQMLMFQSSLPICFMNSENKVTTTILVENDFKNPIKEYILRKRIKYSPSYDFEMNKYKLKDLWMEA